MNVFRIALRQQIQRPGFALTVVATLGLTIGATTAVFSVVNSVLVHALPFQSPEHLVWIASVRPDNPSAPFSLPEFMDYRSRAGTLAGLAAYANWSASLSGDGVTEKLQGARMSANAFDVLGVAPSAGRLLDESDDRPEAPRVVVLSYPLWQRLYGGAAAAVGRSVRINSESFVVVGVLPAQFPLPLKGIDVVTPLAPDRDPLRHLRNSVNFLMMFGRLKPGTNAQGAQSELTAICRSLRQQFPVRYIVRCPVSLRRLHYDKKSNYVLYQPKSKNRKAELLDPREFLARVLIHIPQPNQHSILYYGHYARRGKKSARKNRPADNDGELNTTNRKTLRRRWANLIRRVFKTDPLLCECGGKFRILSFITEPKVIARILVHLEKRNTGSRDPPQDNLRTPSGSS